MNFAMDLRQTQLTLWTLLCCLPVALVQQVGPSNATVAASGHQYSLQTSEVSMITSYRLQPLTPDANLGAVCLC